MFLQQEWEEMCRQIGMDRDCTVQRIDMRRAFHAGASALLKVMFLQQELEEMCRQIGMDRACTVQRIEMRRAFHAGASALLKVLLIHLAEVDEVMLSLDKEIKAFFADVASGKA